MVEKKIPTIILMRKHVGLSDNKVLEKQLTNSRLNNFKNWTLELNI